MSNKAALLGVVRPNQKLNFLLLRSISCSGNAINSLIAPLLTYKVFGSMKLMGIAFAIEWLPRVFSALYSGQLVQRFGASNLYAVSELLRAIAFGLMALCAFIAGTGQPSLTPLILLLIALPLVQAGAGILETISEESAGHATGSESLGQTICRISDKFSRIFIMPLIGVMVYLTNDPSLPALLGCLLMLASLAYSRQKSHLLYQPKGQSYQSLGQSLKLVFSRQDQWVPTLALSLLTLPMAMQWSIIPLYLGMDPANPQTYRDFSVFAAIEALIVIFGVSTMMNRSQISRKGTWSILMVSYVSFMTLCLLPLDRVILAAAHIGWVMSVACIGVLVRIERQEKLSGTDKATFAGVLGALEYSAFVFGGLFVAAFGAPSALIYTVATALAFILLIEIFTGSKSNE